MSEYEHERKQDHLRLYIKAGLGTLVLTIFGVLLVLIFFVEIPPAMETLTATMGRAGTYYVLGYSLNKIEENGYYPDIVVSLEIVYPYRPDDLIDKMIIELIDKGLDSVVAGFPEYRIAWTENDKEKVL